MLGHESVGALINQGFKISNKICELHLLNSLPVRQGYGLQPKQRHQLDQNHQAHIGGQLVQTNCTRHYQGLVGH